MLKGDGSLVDTFKDIVSLPKETLKIELLKCKRSLFLFRCQKKTEPAKPHEIKNVRRRVARLETALLQKSFNAKGE